MAVIGVIFAKLMIAWLNYYLATQRGRGAMWWVLFGAGIGLPSTIMLLVLGKTEKH